MEAKLTSIGEVTLGAALECATLSDGDPAALLLFSGGAINAALEEIGTAALDNKDSGQAYHDLAAMTLLACAAYHEMRKDT